MPPFGPVHVLVAILSVLSTITSTKLSKEEDLSRSVTCGKAAPQSKLFEGKHVAGSDAPWMVKVEHGKDGQTGKKSGFLLSNRHVVTSSDAFLDHGHANKTDTFRWIYNMTYSDLATCIDRTMPVPKFALQGAVVHLCSGEPSGSDCGTAAAINVIDAMYMGNCDQTMMSYGLIVMELEKPVDTASVPVCITDIVGEIDEEVSMYGLGDAAGTSALNTRQAKVVKCTNAERHIDLSVCFNTGTCDDDVGGLIARNVEGQLYALGVFWSFACSIDDNVNQVSVPKFHDKICEVTGVCLTVPTVPPTTPAPTTPAPTQRPVQKPDDPSADPVEDVADQAATETPATESSASMAMLPGLAILLVFSL